MAGIILACALALSTLLTGCLPPDEEASQPAPEPIRPVRVVTVEKLPGGERVTLTGTVQAQDDVALAFRVGGQLIERTVNVGDQVTAGQVIARLDATPRIRLETDSGPTGGARAGAAFELEY
jgi:multidrug efflux pump subunit AcrA (membrane-fusion protein)